jgi:hypothetical protein
MPVGIALGQHFPVIDDHRLFIAQLPLLDDRIEQLLEALDNLPHDLCLFLDRDAERFRVLRCDDALRLDGGQHVVIDRRATENLGDQARSESPHAENLGRGDRNS